MRNRAEGVSGPEVTAVTWIVAESPMRVLDRAGEASGIGWGSDCRSHHHELSANDEGVGEDGRKDDSEGSQSDHQDRIEQQIHGRFEQGEPDKEPGTIQCEQKPWEYKRNRGRYRCQRKTLSE